MIEQKELYKDFCNIALLDIHKDQPEVIKSCRKYYAQLMSQSFEPGVFVYDADLEFSDYDFLATMSFFYLTQNFKEMQALRDKYKVPLGFTQELYIAYLFGGPIPKILFFLLLYLVCFKEEAYIPEFIMKYTLFKTNYWIWKPDAITEALIQGTCI